jgi:hypothetical protein
VSVSQTNFLAAMTDCADRRQIRTRYQEPRDAAGRPPGLGDEADEIAMMVECNDPRQIRIHYSSPSLERIVIR